jgi:hypothetical protein
MTAGLPGTGIGGLFYLLLVLFMPLREAFRLLRGRGDVRRWRTIGGKLLLAGGILAALWVEAWVLFEMFGLRRESFAATFGANAEQAARAARAASFATLATLGLVLFALAVLRLLVRRPRPGVCVQADPVVSLTALPTVPMHRLVRRNGSTPQLPGGAGRSRYAASAAGGGED